MALRAEAADQEHLQRVELLVADHLDRFGAGEHLTVTWTPQGAGDQLSNPVPDARDDNAPG